MGLGPVVVPAPREAPRSERCCGVPGCLALPRVAYRVVRRCWWAGRERVAGELVELCGLHDSEEVGGLVKVAA